MSKCVGCGLTVNSTSGFLEAELCDKGGIKCASTTSPSPDGCTSGLYVQFPAFTQGGTLFPPNPVPGSTTNQPTALGCGLTTDTTGKVIVQISADTCLNGAGPNALVCRPDGGLYVPSSGELITKQAFTGGCNGDTNPTGDSGGMFFVYHGNRKDLALKNTDTCRSMFVMVYIEARDMLFNFNTPGGFIEFQNFQNMAINSIPVLADPNSGGSWSRAGYTGCCPGKYILQGGTFARPMTAAALLAPGDTLNVATQMAIATSNGFSGSVSSYCQTITIVGTTI